MNYPDNAYLFRQDSSFLYFFGLDTPHLAGWIDVDEGREVILGNDVTIEEIIWMGPQPALAERAAAVGIDEAAPFDQLGALVADARGRGRTIHYLPQYRPENVLRLHELLGLGVDEVRAGHSLPLIRGVVEQRSTKSAEEVAEIERAIDVAHEMHTTAMALARPGVVEREVAGVMEGIALSHGSRLSFPTIFSVHGETLHNHHHDNVMADGDIAVADAGAESPLHYAADITRTIPVGGRFTQRQREVYSIVLSALEAATGAARPGVENRVLHELACVKLATGLGELGLMRGDPAEAVEAGAHTLFFQCGLGHLLGLDVHDMEGLGEDHVGYDDRVQRNPSFGFRSLRLGRALEPGFAITVEPGLYFIPTLIDRWKAERTLEQFIDYDAVEAYRDFGGIRIEDDVLVTEEGHRLLGRPIPRSIAEVEAACAEGGL